MSSTLKVHRFQTADLFEHVTKFAILLGLVAVVTVIGYASLQTTVTHAF